MSEELAELLAGCTGVRDRERPEGNTSVRNRKTRLESICYFRPNY